MACGSIGRMWRVRGESVWAYLPVGPLERHFWKGNQGGFWEEVPKNPQERVTAFLWKDIMGKPLLITI
ncbi:hypothetical protein SBA5_140034 [Candidatus Sulfotelmatomonas gaucii]|uniref:Uncharacterized protein n=1 Tax=Candidatus Sulfuritelmatomonas gaucii TaxID=2043161 RepID=A0A2N9L4D1_9BACT|nr:hypothetical protein SBA5_140034 [Candidatus Sulfotelmatomonas gaucii]